MAGGLAVDAGRLAPEAEVLTLVFLGTFHPGVLQPAWLALKNLIPETEATDARVQAVTSEFTRFETDWLIVDVLPERLQLTTRQAPYLEILKDLAIGVLRESPMVNVKAFGINHIAHFKMTSEPAWHALGHQVVPKHLWDDILKDPGTAKVAVQGTRPDGLQGKIVFTLEPSLLVRPGIALSTNDHYDLSSEVGPGSADTAATLIDQQFQPSIDRSRAYFIKFTQLASKLEAER